MPPGQAIFTGPTCPLFHFLADRPDPSPFTDFTFYYFDEENQERVIEALERARVDVAVIWPRMVTGFWFRSAAPRLAEYLEHTFSPERTIGRFLVYRRR